MRPHESVRVRVSFLALPLAPCVVAGCQEATPPPVASPVSSTPAAEPTPPPRGVKTPTDKSLKME